MTQEDIMLDEKELAKLKHALGMDNKDAVHGIYEAYRRCSVYNEPIKEWDNLVRKGFATKSVDSDNQISYRVTEKGMKKVADATGLMIKYTLEFEPNTDLKNFTLTQEEKELVLNDVFQRLRYGVKAKTLVDTPETPSGSVIKIRAFDYDIDDTLWINGLYEIDEIKLFLRPMSSMTNDEKTEYFVLHHRAIDRDDNLICPDEADELVIWLYKHHLDFHRFIEKGIALPATEEMYKNE